MSKSKADIENERQIATADLLARIKQGGARLDSGKWFAFFNPGDFLVFRFDRLIPRDEAKRESGRFYGRDVNGEAFVSFASAIVENSLEAVEPGHVVLIEFTGKERHPKPEHPGQTIKRYEVYDLGTDFPHDAPAVDWDDMKRRIEVAQGKIEA